MVKFERLFDEAELMQGEMLTVNTAVKTRK